MALVTDHSTASSLKVEQRWVKHSKLLRLPVTSEPSETDSDSITRVSPSSQFYVTSGLPTDVTAVRITISYWSRWSVLEPDASPEWRCNTWILKGTHGFGHTEFQSYVRSMYVSSIRYEINNKLIGTFGWMRRLQRIQRGNSTRITHKKSHRCIVYV